jgi:hypothetical protein
MHLLPTVWQLSGGRVLKLHACEKNGSQKQLTRVVKLFAFWSMFAVSKRTPTGRLIFKREAKLESV